MSVKDELRSRLTIALTEVTAAEEVLSGTLAELGSGGPRAAKVSVTAAVSDAFGRLRRAHEELTRVRDLIESDLLVAK
jgi:hypothetical protein